MEFSTVHSILRRLSRKYPRVFDHIIQIPSARVPIIKTIYLRNGISCDLSFENFLSVRNSRLIKLYTKIDHRVRPLMCVIRYWGKFYELTDSTKIKNYGLNLLVLTYLIQKGIIPSIYELQYWTPKDGRCRIEDWDASFLEDEILLVKKLQEVHGILPPVSCRMVLELMLGFCQLYASFNASDDVVCTLTADFLPRRSFCPGYEQELPPELNAYKEWCYAQEIKDRLHVTSERPFVIQDPFVLNYNVSAVTSSFALQKFQYACEGTADFLQKILNLPAAEFKKTKLTDIFFPIKFPAKQRKAETAEVTKNSHSQTDDGENHLPRDKHQQKQMGFACRPTPEYRQAFYNQFASSGFPHDEVVFRGNSTWLKYVKEFALIFFNRCYSLDTVSTVEFLPRKQLRLPPKPPPVTRRGSHDNTETNLVPKVRTKPRHVPPEVHSDANDTQNSSFPGSSNSNGYSSSYEVKESTSECSASNSSLTLSNAVDEDDDGGAASDDSTLSFSTIELISAILRNPSPRELLDSVNVTEYTPQKLVFRYSGSTHNVWDGRDTILSQLIAEDWKGETGDPLETETEITRRLFAKEENKNKESVPVSFDCSITLRPESYKVVYADIQFRESQGFHMTSLLKALKSTMLTILNPYVHYRYAQWTEGLQPPTITILNPLNAADPSSSSSILPTQQHSTPRQKPNLRKPKSKQRKPSSSSSAGLLEPGQQQDIDGAHPHPEGKPLRKERRGKEMVIVSSAHASQCE